MIARKFSLLRQLAWAATLATGFGTLWFMLVVWLGTSIRAGLAGRESAGFRKTRGQVRRHALDPEQPARQSV